MKNIFALLLFLATSPIYATTYYVDCNNGNNNNSGTSHTQAWKTVSNVNSKVTVSGNDVYFLAGCTWNETLTIDWGGTSGNRAIVGSYYMNAGTEIIGVPSGTENPTFEGTCKSSNNCPYDTKLAIPSGQWVPLINIKRNYTTVQHLKAKNSSGVGINVFGTNAGKQKYNNNYILDNVVEHTLNNGIALSRTSHTNVVRGNTVTKASMIKPYGFNTNWPASIGLASSDNNVIEDNYVYHSFGEAIGVFSKSDNNIIRNNLIIKGNKAGIYVSCSADNIIENNKVIGDRTDSLALIKNGYPSVSAYAAASETYCHANTSGNIYRNNLATNIKHCFSNEIQMIAGVEGFKAINEFYNNTCVNAYTGFRSPPNGNPGSAYATFKNNILTNVDKKCDQVDSYSTVDYNHWDALPSDADCKGSNDVYGNPKLNTTTEWTNFSITNIPPDDYFKSLSTAVNSGTQLTTVALVSADYPQISLMDNSCTFDQSKNSYDHNCNKRKDTNSIGAFSNNSDAIGNPLQSPSGLSLKINTQ